MGDPRFIEFVSEPSEMVNHPAHYANRAYETIDVIEDTLTSEQFIGMLLGNAMKYLSRCQAKGNMIQDVMKAVWYLDRLTDTLEREEDGQEMMF